ncbi:MAG: SpoIIE family protein phosphatase [Phycisphaerales bacterium]|jgi:phosphoserine phosphatase|nr:SpoIIE family protein phosphatase [Phycisphaerales bacterium]
MPEVSPEQVDCILEVSRILGSTDDPQAVICRVADCLRDILDAERATVFEYHPKTDELVAAAGHGPDGTLMESLEDIRVPLGTGIAGTAGANHTIINIPDAYADDRFYRGVDEKTGYRTRSILTIPLIAVDVNELVGVAQILNRRAGPFGADCERIATALAAQSAVAMRRSRLLTDRLELVKLQHDLDIARDIQTATFPGNFPETPDWEIYGWSMPADATGGDAFDAVEVDGGAMLMVGDATGHGIGPAISVTQVRSMLRMAVRLDASLLDLVRELNQQLWQDTSAMQFVTAWFGRLDNEAGTIESIAAGHGPMMLLRADGSVESIEADAPPLGVLETLMIDSATMIDMHPGDLLAIPSDGIFEATDETGEMYGVNRMVDLLRDSRGQSLRDNLELLRADTEAFRAERPAQDDRTILAVRRCT